MSASTQDEVSSQGSSKLSTPPAAIPPPPPFQRVFTPSTGAGKSGGATAKSGSVRQALVEIRKAAAQEDAALLRKAILQWADLHHEHRFSSLEALARVSTESLATRLRAVDRSLYGDGELSSAMEGLIDTLREEPAPQGRGPGANTLSLYPS